jgi:hypothetical protein
MVDTIENAIEFVYVLSQSNRTLLPQSADAVDGKILVLSPQEGDMLRILDFEGHEQTHDFEGIKPFVNVVAEENVFVAFHLVLVWETEVFEEPYEVKISAVYAAEYLDGRSYCHQTGLFDH